MNPVTGLALGRIGVGVASLARPALVGSALTGRAAADDGTGLVTQWFGTREVALGVATLLASGSARRNLVLIGAAVDAADAATAYAGVAGESLPPRTGYVLVGVAVGAVVSGLLGLRVRRTTAITAA